MKILVKIAIFLILTSITIMFPPGIFPYKLQVSDIVFLIVFFPLLLKFISEKRNIYWSPFIKPIAIYLSVAFISIFVSLSIKTTAGEFIGLSYLIALFLLWINTVYTKELLNYAIWCWILVSIAISIIGLIGIILAYGLHLNNPFVTLFEKHPYINNLYRVHSTFFQNEKFLSSYLLISISLALSLVLCEKRRKVKFFLLTAILLFLINVFFTYSRTIVGILIAIYIVIFRSHKISLLRNKNMLFAKILKSICIVFIVSALIAICLFSQLQLIDISSKTVTLFNLPENMEEPYYYRPDIGIKQTKIDIRYNYTYYLFLKEWALRMFARHPFRGVGNGAFIEQMKIYDREGKIPKDYLLFDPHSMFFGSLAELGIFGFFSLMYLWLTIILILKKRLKDCNGNYDYHLALAFYAATIGFFIQGIDIDIMNFRFLWILFGFDAAILKIKNL